jgi:phenylpropionate dioxygenase-like ring-hydroxylating dioxygenase large terminal subunit
MRPIRAAQPESLVQLAGPPAEMIFGDWYPALRSASIKAGGTALTTLLGIPMLLGRKSSGELFAMRDLCPHRGIPLSAGWFDGDTVQCKYHGWRFEPCSGRCEEIPSLTSHDDLEPTKIFANTFPVAERDGYAWVYVPPAGAGRIVDEATLPPVPELPKFGPRYRSAHLHADLPCNVDHGIIGLMDPAHGPFVHRAWWWRSAASIHEKTKNFEPIEDREHAGHNAGFRMSPHAVCSASPSLPSTSRSPTGVTRPSSPKKMVRLAGSLRSQRSRRSRPPPAASMSSPPGTSHTTCPSSRRSPATSARASSSRTSRR